MSDYKTLIGHFPSNLNLKQASSEHQLKKNGAQLLLLSEHFKPVANLVKSKLMPRTGLLGLEELSSGTTGKAFASLCASWLKVITGNIGPELFDTSF